MTWYRWFFAVLGWLSVLLLTLPAGAQTLTIAPTGVTRPERSSPSRLGLYAVNYADCVNDDYFQVAISVTGASNSFTLQIWEGTGCEASTARQGNDPTCTEIAEFNSSVSQVELPVRSIIAAHSNSSGTDVEACNQTGATGAQTANVHFLLVDSAGELPSGFTPAEALQITYDLIGPAPPDSLEVGIGENSLIVDFEAPTEEPDLNGYAIYCEPISGDTCAGTELVEGEQPPPNLRCGELSKNTESGQTDDDRENYQQYAVGVVSLDNYDNPGPLSTIACGTPEPISGFYEEYRAAGGQGGGGFCSLSGSSRARVEWLFGLGLATVVLIRRRLARMGGAA